MPVAEVEGWELAYSDTGSGPPVVLLHGLLMDRSMFDHQIDALSDSYRIVTVDAPGHGESPGRPAGFTLADEARVLSVLATQLGIDRAVWGGHSMGGMKAASLAIDDPQRVRALILIDASARPENPDMLPQYEAMFEVAKQDGVSHDLAQMAFAILSTNEFAQSSDGQRWVKRIEAMDPHATFGSARAVFDRPDRMSDLSRISAPALIVHGSDDLPISIDIARETAANIAGSRLVEIAGSGHTSPVEKPHEVTNAIRAFLDGLPA